MSVAALTILFYLTQPKPLFEAYKELWKHAKNWWVLCVLLSKGQLKPNLPFLQMKQVVIQLTEITAKIH